MKTIKKRDADKSRKLILDSAESLFAQKGYHKTSLSDIAEHSGLSRTTPSYFFRNKEQLYRCVIQRLLENEKQYLNELVSKAGGVSIKAIRIILERHIDYTFENPNLAKILVSESLNKDRPEWIMDVFPEMISWSHQYLSEAKRQGLIREDVDVDHLWLNALAMAWLPILTEHTFYKVIGKDVSTKEFVEKQKEQMAMMIFRSILPE